ncbi:MAG: DUF4136 domain-containing protein [Bacteroidetes bacterium]|nr:DUF4136 domain-containing protein [Bacteroidota bacterium]
MKHLMIVAATALALGLSACSSVSITSDYDPSVDFTKYKDYAWHTGEGIPGDALAADPLLKRRVVAAVDKALAAHGFQKVELTEADFVVVTHAGTKEKMRVTDWGSYGWYDPWWGPYGGRVDVSYYDEGTLVIDFVDSQEKQLTWRGLAKGTIRNEPDSEERQRALEQLAADILADFPPKK